VENRKLSFREVVIKNINCVTEGLSTKEEAVNEILGELDHRYSMILKAFDECIKIVQSIRNKRTSEYLNNLTLEDAIKLYEIQGIYLHCGDGKVHYAAPVEVADCLSMRV
jgi:hypothetical protein